MESVFKTEKEVEIHERYDLKGSWVDRSTAGVERGITKRVLKDSDLHRQLRLSPEARERLIEQSELDARFLCSMGIMDYSLLMGIHHTTQLSFKAATKRYLYFFSTTTKYANWHFFVGHVASCLFVFCILITELLLSCRASHKDSVSVDDPSVLTEAALARVAAQSIAASDRDDVSRAPSVSTVGSAKNRRQTSMMSVSAGGAFDHRPPSRSYFQRTLGGLEADVIEGPSMYFLVRHASV